jgi:uncharacterized protein (DUF1501 family)
MNRREFVAGCSTAIAAMAGSKITSYGFSPVITANGDIFVYIFLRGGCDGLNLVAPVNDPDYVTNRTSDVRLMENGDTAELSLNNGLAGLDFRIHPKAPELKELYDGNALAIIHAAGLTNGTRSHFDAMEARISDAPRANEIVVAVVVTDSGRPLPRVGGLQTREIKGEDGLR